MDEQQIIKLYAAEWEGMRDFIPSDLIYKAANKYYDIAREMGVTGWDGTTQLERDGRINQDLE